MKLVRYGRAGPEKRGLIDEDGVVRDRRSEPHRDSPQITGRPGPANRIMISSGPTLELMSGGEPR